MMYSKSYVSRPILLTTAFLLSASLLFACNDGDDGSGRNGANGGDKTSGNDNINPVGNNTNGNNNSNNNGDANCGVIQATIRDFRSSRNPNGGHGDFETYDGGGATKGMVAATLGTDNKPVYNYDAISGNLPHGPQLTSEALFNQWYRDEAGVNQSTTINLPLTNGVYDDSDFFPIDGMLFGNTPEDYKVNDSPAHNFHFTTEIHISFTYNSADNQVFSFRGDDDLWIFVNGRLALDVGGLHGAVEDSIDFNSMATELGLESGQQYNMDIFHAERHTSESNFRITTNIQCFQAPVLS